MESDHPQTPDPTNGPKYTQPYLPGPHPSATPNPKNRFPDNLQSLHVTCRLTKSPPKATISTTATWEWGLTAEEPLRFIKALRCLMKEAWEKAWGWLVGGRGTKGLRGGWLDLPRLKRQTSPQLHKATSPEATPDSSYLLNLHGVG